jgi:hypothetical protein
MPIKSNNIDTHFSYSKELELQYSFSEHTLQKICTLCVNIECNKNTNWIPNVVYKVDDIINNIVFSYTSLEYDEAIKCFDKISEIFDGSQF